MKGKRVLAGLLAAVMIMNSSGLPTSASDNAAAQPGVESQEVTPTEESDPVNEQEPVQGGEENAPEEEENGQNTTSDVEETTPIEENTGSEEDDPDGSSAQNQTGAQEENSKVQTEPAQSGEIQRDAQTDGPAQNQGTTEQPGDPDESSGKTFDQVAEEYYGENGTLTPATVRVQRSGGDTVKAGDTIKLTLDYVLKAAGVYNYGEMVQPLFDAYDTVKIYLRLPEGLQVIEDSEIRNNVRDIITPEEAGEAGQSELKEKNIYTFELDGPVSAVSDMTRSFDVNVKVDGNGKLPVGKIFDFAGDAEEGDSLAEIYTEFTIQDRTDPNNIKDGKTYKKTLPMEGTIDDLVTASDDVWGIAKEGVSDATNPGKTEVTVTYNLHIGLVGDDGKIVSNANTYGRVGRVPFAGEKTEVTLTELPKVLNRQGEEIQAKSIKVTPQFDNKASILVGKDGTIPLPVDTCEGKFSSSSVAGSAPYYSSYTVEIVYPYQDFIANYHDENQDKLRVTNTAKITYRLAGENTDWTAEAEAEREVGEVTKPAKLTIGKFISPYDGKGEPKPYTYANFPTGDPVSGGAVFEIEDEQGQAPKLYVEENGKYKELTGANGQVTISPSEGITSSDVTVYLDPGTYTVEEVDEPDNTEKITEAEDGNNNAEAKTVEIAAEGSARADFYDKENLGRIEITKRGLKGGDRALLPGAEFGLYKDQACSDPVKNDKGYPVTVTTGENGTAVFDRLPYDTYYVKEINAPTGYIKDSKVEEAVISGQKHIYQFEFTNKYNQAHVVMQKQIYDVDKKDYVDVNAAYATEFAKCFDLQQYNSTTDKWEIAVVKGDGTYPERKEDMSLGNNGQLLLTLPVYQEDGVTPIKYRFAETLPEGWHVPVDSKNTEASEDGKTAYSAEFTLVQCLGNGTNDPCEILMENDRNGSIELTKEFYEATAGGMKISQSTTLTATFDLYYQNGKGGEFKKYNTGSYQVTGSQGVTIKDLPRVEGNEDRYYYLVETGFPNGYGESEKAPTGDNGASKTTIQIGQETKTAYGPFNFTEEMKNGTNEVVLAQSITIANVEQKIPVVVQKQDIYTQQFVPGASYSIVQYDNDEEGQEVVKSTVIDSNAGSFVKLTPGHKYLVKETITPAGYHDVTEVKDRIIDLTDDKPDKDTKVERVVLKNEPDPTMKITKVKVGADGKQNSISGISFEVYRKTSDNTMERVTYNGKMLSITAGGEALQLPAGEYYLKEVVTEESLEQILDPSVHSDLYEKDGIKVGNSFYFGPYNVEQKEEVNTYKSIENYSAQGAVKVTKYRAAANQEDPDKVDYIALGGATIGIYEKTADGLTHKQTLTSAASGEATFTNLPIYDDSGKKITYVIKEIEAPDGYTRSEKELEVQLEPGKTVETDAKGETLRIVNQPETSLTVTKYFHNMWEHEFTGKSYLLPGTVIALYRKQVEDGVTTYVYENVQTTDENGEVKFEGLTQKDEYVAIEVCVPDDEAYMYLEPAGRKEYLDKDYQEGENLPKEITETDLAKYSYVTKAANPESNPPKGGQRGDLLNVENWAQLQVRKYVVDDKNTDDQSDDIEREIRNAEFTLYRQVVEGTDTILSFNETDCTVVGSYTSGTLYDKDGKRLDGWFGTDILKAADNVVYWLVETKPGIGAKIIPENAITLVKRNNTAYENHSIYEYEDEKTGAKMTADCKNVFEYLDNQVTDNVSVQNDPTEGPGSAMFSTVRIAKWAGRYSEEGDEKVEEYTPLGNASFDLYLADEEGHLYDKLDTLTTGLDNEIDTSEDASEAKEPLSAWASSKAFSWEGLKADYGSKKYFTNTYEDDDYGNIYLRVALVESNAPTGYMASQDTYYMYMYFKNGGQDTTTEIFNDAYYVKGDHTSVDKDVPLAEIQGQEWALYPTEEEDGSYSLVEGVKDPNRYRLVNWPVDNFAVTVQKYGYEVQDDNLRMTSQQLDAYYLSGVHTDRRGLSMTMRLDRLTDGQWQPYNYDGEHEDGRFTTDVSGGYYFPQGLRVGKYRIVEISAAETAVDYEMIYNGTVQGGAAGERNARAYYFDVTTENVDITMYNPKKISFDIKKTDADGDSPLSGVTFTLTEQGGDSSKVEVKTAENGIAKLSGIESGTYKLSESGLNLYSSQYFSKYFNETYGDTQYNELNNLVNGSGIYFGYIISQEGQQTGDSGLVVNRKTDLSDYGVSQGIALEIRNPAKGGFTIQKTDKNDSTQKLKGAQFAVAYQLFAGWNGDQSFTDEKWSQETTYTTDANGQCKITGLEPGLYRVRETKAPEGYDITDPEPKYIAVTGGMNIPNVILKKDGAESEVIINDDTHLVFRDSKQVQLSVTKQIDKGGVEVSGDASFTFGLYENREDTKPIDTLTVTSKKGAEVTGTFPKKLSQGKTYYLREISAADGYAFESLAASSPDGFTLQEEGAGWYSFTVPASNSDLAVTAVNQYLWAEITVLKVDGEDGTCLTGADFAVYRENENAPLNVEFQEISTGVYTVKVPLQGNAQETFRIYETKQPDNYLLDKEQSVKVTVEPGDSLQAPTWNDRYVNHDAAMLDARIFPNYKGAYIDLTKFDNVHGSEDAKALGGATFTLYQKTGDTWTASATGQTDEKGQLRFTVTEGPVYAVAETAMPEGYNGKGLEGIWTDPGDEKAGTEEAVIQGTPRTLHLINGGESLQAGQSYAYNAYNIPYVAMEIWKQNTDGTATAPTATVSVYEMPETMSDQPGRTEVEAFLANGPEALLSGVQVNKLSEDETYSYSTDERLRSRFVAGGRYLVVETAASISQIRDNSNVVWYQPVLFKKGSSEPQRAVLKNLEGTVSSSLTKSADKHTYKSLFTEGAGITYTLTPTVDNSYPLASFTLTDQGFAAYYETTEGKPEEGYTLIENALDNQYTLSQVTVGQSTHDTTAYKEAGNDDIYAEVTFYGFDGKELLKQEVNVSRQGQTVTCTEARGRAKSFSVRYYSKGIQKSSEGAYVLGDDFTPGAVTVQARVRQQQGGPNVHAIDMIRNTAKTDLTYYEWTVGGEREQDPKKQTQNAQTDVTFEDQKAALVEVEKRALSDSVRLEGTVTYELILKNISELTDPEAALVDPFLVDFLPQGSTWVKEDDDLYGVTLVGPPDIKLDHTRSQSVNGETGVFIYLKGSLKPGESATVCIQVKAEKAVVSYGTAMRNYVVAGSNQRGAQSIENPRAASFKNKNKGWAEGIDSVITDISRREGFKEVLGEMDEYGYVSAADTVTWSTDTQMEIVKAGYGNGNASAGYSSTALSTITNEDGMMHYQLTASNTNENYGRTDISFVDVLPAEGDLTSGNADRGSDWALEFETLERVYIRQEDGEIRTVDPSHYQVYYYTGNDDYADIYQAAETVKFGASTLPPGWSKDADDLSNVRAFIVAVSTEEKLTAHESIVVEYAAVVNGGEGFDDAELTENAWKNAVNSCACHYSSYDLSDESDTPEAAMSVIGSNPVSNTIVPERAKVGGHVWIDKDADGTWEDGEDVNTLKENNMLIRELLKEMEVQLYTYIGQNSTSSFSERYVHSDDWNGYFEFGADPNNPENGTLTPARSKDNATEEMLYQNGVLQPSQLKGTAPVTYTIGADIQNAISGKFKLTKTTVDVRKSYNPAEIPEKDKKDNNFTAQGDGRLTERFYLWSGDTPFDNTKDIGLVPYRDLEITKVADDDPSEPVQGAKFTVYGPFDEDAQSYDLNNSPIVNTYTTGQDGKVTVPDLLWYKKYVIVEEQAAEGYVLTDAEGEATTRGTSIEKLPNEKPAWVLGVPTYEKEDALDKMTVTNKRQTEVQLTAYKKLMMNGQEQGLEAGQFTFELLGDDGTTVLDTKKNDEEGKVTFNKLTLEGAGKRTYYIKEQIEGVNPKDGITYDTSLYKVTVDVRWDDTQNKLVPHITYEKQAKGETTWTEAGAVTFENIYNAKGTLDLNARKTVNGKAPESTEEGRFSFTLTPEGGAPGEIQTKTNAADGSVTFDSIQYDTDDIGKTYTYTVEEGTVQAAEDLKDNYKPDETVYKVQVKITDAGKGQLNVDKMITKNGSTDQVNEILFDNTYTASASWTPVASKILTGRDITNGEFSFAVLEGTEVVSTGSVPAGTAGQKTEIIFKPISYGVGDVGTHTYTVKETTENGNGVTVDKSEYEVIVTVSDNRDGSLGIAADYPADGITFSNSYQAKETSYKPAVTKTVTGQKMPAGGQEFTFTLSQISGQNYDGVTMPANATLKLKAESTGVQVSGTFEAITFAKAGSYQFKIEEEDGGATGVTYDLAEWILTVSVKDDLKGNLYIDTTETIYQTEDGGAGDTAAAAFENIYQPLSTPLALKAVKTVTGNAMPGAKDFTFLLAAGGTYTRDQLEMPKDLTATAHVTAAGTPVEALFQEITFKQAGEYSFTITEQKPQSGQEDGYYYSKAIWNVAVKVTDEAGQLKAEATYTCADESNQSGAAFENRYNPKDAPFTPMVRKTLNGYEDLPGQTDFTFTLTASEDNPAGASLKNGESITTSLPMTAQTTEGRGTATFKEITFDRTGIYTFAISENGTDGKGFDYDETKWTLTVTVTDDNGTLKAEGSYAPQDGTANDEAAAFTNSYTVKEIPYTPEAVKKFTEDSADRPQNKETFTFTLKQADGNREGGAVFTDGKETLKASVTDAGKAAFDGQITFKKSGWYSFLITEDVPESKSYNYGYDDTKWTLQVKVMDKEGQLTVESVSYTADDGRTGDGQAVFSNSYKVDPTAYAPQVEKTVTGADMPDGQSFTFDLKKMEGEDYEGVTMPQGQPGSSIQIKTDKTGESYTGKFGEIQFTKAGEYRFAITEQDDTADTYPDAHYGFGYDKTEWTLTVTVEDVGGKLDVTSTAYEAGGHEMSDAEASFENSYQTEPTDYAPAVVKTLSDDSEPTPTDETFIFTLTGEEQDGAVLPSDTEAEVSGEGTARFDNIQFTKAGEYSFTIKEKEGSAKGYTYDPTEWTLTVHVKDVSGKLSVTGTVYEAEGQESSETAAAFENDYHIEPVFYAPEVQKKLTGDKAPDDKTFIFNLEAGEERQGMTLPEETTAEITGEGKAAFDQVKFTEAGTYILVITEEDTREPGYTYDETEWIVAVEVVDKGGYLEVKDVTYQSSEEAAANEEADGDRAVFTNQFAYTEAEYTPSVRKNISGDKPDQNDTFTFRLEQSLWNDKEAVQLTGESASVVNSGTAQFGRILFGKPGTYEFKIQEDKGNAAGYTYDKSTWTLKVTVVNEDNVLVVESAVYTKNGTDVTSTEAAAFTNTYSAAAAVSGAARTGDTTPWQPLTAALILSGGAIVVLYRRRKRQAE
nr:FctA domain-containing protein [Lachnoclostridium phocaeense]